MRITTLLMSLFILWMAWQPCTDKNLPDNGHLQQVVDPADTTGESPFHEDSCPVFCVCTCCATLIVSNDYPLFVFREFTEQLIKPLQLLTQQEKHLAFVLWHPPRHTV